MQATKTRHTDTLESLRRTLRIAKLVIARLHKLLAEAEARANKAEAESAELRQALRALQYPTNGDV